MDDERTRLRRHDRAMPGDAQVEEFLKRALFGFLGTSVDDQPYVVPKLFWYDDTTRRIYFHSAIEGRTRDTILRNPQVCFSAAQLGRVLLAEQACELGVEYASVCIFGRARRVQSDEERLHGLRGLVRKFSPAHNHAGTDPVIDAGELRRTAVYAIEIEAWSGKQQDVG